MYISVRDSPTDERETPAGRVRRRVAGPALLLGVVSLLTDVSSEMVSAVLPLYLTAEVGIGLLAYAMLGRLRARPPSRRRRYPDQPAPDGRLGVERHLGRAGRWHRRVLVSDTWSPAVVGR